MPRLTLRWKLLLFAVAIAVVPILVAGRTMIRIGEDELKSSANEQLLGVASELSREINDVFEGSWLGPLLLIRNAIDDDQLGVEEKIAILTLGISDIADIVALQITVDGADIPLIVTKDDFSKSLQAAGLDPLEVLRVSPEQVRALRESEIVVAEDAIYVPESDNWLATIVLPLRSRIAGADAVLSARIDLHRLWQIIYGNPFTKVGFLTVVDRKGREVLNAGQRDLSHHAMVADAMTLLSSSTRSLGVAPYARPDGEVMLGAYAFPRPFRWALLVELRQRDAYLAVEKMTRSLVLWGAAGLAVAVLGAIALAFGISRPILEIDRVAGEVAKGNFAVRVLRGVRLNDEIGDLARRMNAMIVGLAERLQLEKFVSLGTITAIRGAEQYGVRLGGARHRATMLFCDIRGYTAFAEQHEPDLVIDVLNFYFQHLAGLVKEHHGDIDKFVGDQILAVFAGEGGEGYAVRCALAMQAKMSELSADRPSWNLAVGVGINTGDVIMGAMGSVERMDYTVLGDAVNVAARLCSLAERGQSLVSQTTFEAIGEITDLRIEALAPIQLKGKRDPVQLYQVCPNPTVGLVAERDTCAVEAD
ncbi:adenylate/guanylate cyclase domain-containing protein [Rhodospirillaceae bacterium SYSU D60014]|uniref:adenylate/guanylate cyclase domain-containing protein n=1 Tax=Virgifigura deserti TaxID=2268457 RepID=UPI000E66D40B